MVIRLRKPDRRRFQSSINIRRTRRREYFYASISVLLVKIVLFIFLLVLADVSYRALSRKFQGLNPVIKVSVPIIVLIFAVGMLYLIYKNIKQIRELSKEKDKIV